MNISMRVLIGLTIISLAFFAGYTAQPQSGSTAPIKPFVARKHIDFFPSTSTTPPQATDIVYARRSDGSYMRSFSTTAPNGESGRAVEISDLRRRQFSFLEPFTKSVATYHLTDSAIDKRRAEQNECEEPAGDMKGSKAVMLGHDVRGMVRRTDAETTERWVAPDLGCFALRASITFPQGARNEERVLALMEQEPPPELFQIPSDYTERSPAEIEVLYGARYPGHALWGKKMVEVLEERYKNHRK